MIAANKRKIINDPVYGFINISSEILFDLIEHPYFQRLRRIRQLGLTNFVYPGATHTRFQHAIGSTHLMGLAIEVLRSKGHEISETEAEAVSVAILLHDIGHGPYSHALEHSIVENITHEDISEMFMNELNLQFKGKLDLAIAIFKNQYYKRFLYQLVSSQLDMDRLDYLKRDSFFTGVTEGVIGSDRIIKMLNIFDDQLVVDAKGIYSIEKFLVARRFMYWQVYLHKTVVSAENLLVNILRRAKVIANEGVKLFATPSLEFFLYHNISKKSEFISGSNEQRKIMIEKFNQLDDNDIMASAKVWTECEDRVLALLCKNFINRNLYKIEMSNSPFEKEKIELIKTKVNKILDLGEKELDYFVFSDSISNNVYNVTDDKITILFKSGETSDIAEASDMLNIAVLSKVVKKYFLCYAKLNE